MKTNKHSFLYNVLGIALGLFFMTNMVFSQSFILDLQYNPMSFTNAQRTLLVNTGNSGRNQGSVHKYSNVATVSGVTIYAKLTLLEVNNAFITNFDDDVQTGDLSRFQPRLGAYNNGGYILYQLEFFNTANDESVFLYNYWVTGVDVDGSDYYYGYREYAELGGYTSYQVDASTLLTVSTNPVTGRTRFKGRQGSLNGVTFDNTAAYIVNYANPNNKITFALGITDQNDERYFSVQFGAPDPDGPFSNPETTFNPLPVAVDDVGTLVSTTTGGTAVPNVLTNDLFDGSPIVPSAVTISVVTPSSDPGVVLNTTTGEVTVTPGTPPGDYTIVYQICMVANPGDCDIATISVSVTPALTGPTAVDDIATTNPLTPVDITILSNDSQGDGALDPSSVTLDAGTAPNPATVGTFTVNATTGVVTFNPVATFSGVATIDYEVCDENDLCDDATISVTVTPLIGPTAVDNSAFTDQGVPVVINVLNNDVAGTGTIDPTTVTFVSGTAPNPVTVGTFTVDGTTGLVTFTPVPAFSGITSIDYQVCDVNSLCDDATINVTVNPNNDQDGDGVPDPDDDYPTDPDRAFDHFYPTSGNSSLAFEDLWPGQGDYDFNDLVTDYKFQMVTNASNNLVEIFGTFTIKAFGANLHNGFGFQFANASISQSDLSVTGYELTNGSVVSLGANGLEENQSRPTVILWDDCFDLMEHPGTGTGVNTTPGAPYVTPKTIDIYIEFTGGTYTLAQLDIANFNPFLIVGLERGHEIHLPDYLPTSLVDPSWFGLAQDNSIPSQGRYYKTENNLPWAINIYESFAYPKEMVDIIDAYHHFVEWAVSGGIDHPEWYKDNPGNRESTNIY